MTLAYFIIFLSIAAILGPLMAVLPSKRQRQLAEYRERARNAGLSVSLKAPNNIPPRLQRATDDPLVGYGLYLTPKQASAVSRDVFVRSRFGWEAKSGEGIPESVASLPESAEIVVIGWDNITVYWNERGGDVALKAVFTVLEDLHPAPPEALALSE